MMSIFLHLFDTTHQVSNQLREVQKKTGWWFGTFFIFPYIGNFIIPIDFHIFQRGRSTTNQKRWTSPWKSPWQSPLGHRRADSAEVFALLTEPFQCRMHPRALAWRSRIQGNRFYHGIYMDLCLYLYYLDNWYIIIEIYVGVLYYILLSWDL